MLWCRRTVYWNDQLSPWRVEPSPQSDTGIIRRCGTLYNHLEHSNISARHSTLRLVAVVLKSPNSAMIDSHLGMPSQCEAATPSVGAVSNTTQGTSRGATIVLNSIYRYLGLYHGTIGRYLAPGAISKTRVRTAKSDIFPQGDRTVHSDV